MSLYIWGAFWMLTLLAGLGATAFLVLVVGARALGDLKNLMRG